MRKASGLQLHAEANYIAVMREGALRQQEVPRGFEPRSLDSESRVLTVTPRDQMMYVRKAKTLANARKFKVEVYGSSWLIGAVGRLPHGAEG